MRQLCESAVEAALAAGAEYADARAVVRRSQSVSTKNGRIENVNDVETEGIGVRVLAGGAWGFACDRRLDAEGAVSAARRATAFALASSVGRSRALAPVEARSGSYRTPIAIDPFDVPLADKVDLCLRAEAALRHDTVVVTQASVRAQREHKVLFSSDGVEAEQVLVRDRRPGSTRSPRTTRCRSSAATRARTAARARAPAGSTSRASGSSARRRASASRRRRCCARSRARRRSPTR